MIKQGAGLIENSGNIIDELALNYEHAPKTGTFKEKPVPVMDESEKGIYDLIGDSPIHIDQISRQGNLELGKTSSLLMRIELRVIIRQLPGQLFIRWLNICLTLVRSRVESRHLLETI